MKIETTITWSKEDLNGVQHIATGTSFTPEKRAESYIQMYLGMMEERKELLEKLTVDASQLPTAIKLLTDFKSGLVRHLNEHISAKSKVISAMITGPARFPVARNERNMQRENAKWEAVDSFLKKSERTSVKLLNNALPETVKNKQAVDDFKLVLTNYISYFEEDRGCAHWVRPNSKGKILTFIKNNNKESIREILNYINNIQEGLTKPLWTNRNSIFKSFEDALNAPDEEETKQDAILYSCEHFKIVNSFEVERVQFLFGDKPSEGVRNILKGDSFRWSNKYSAWQRKNTNNGVWVAKRIIPHILKAFESEK